MPYREQKVSEAIKHAVAEIILEDMGNPRLGFVTITAAMISADYKKATVYFTLIGDEDQQAETLRQLTKAANVIKNRLRDKVTLRYLPDLVFEIDTLLKEEQRIGKVIDELKKPQTSEK